jgi:hypothetical protein
MRCAGDRPRRRRAWRLITAAALRGAAVLAVACVAAGCSGSGSAPSGHPPFGRGPGPRRALFGGGAFIVGGGPGGGFIAVAAGPGKGSGRPQISVPPIPRVGSTQPIVMPLDVYEQVATQEQDALIESQTLLTQRCMTDRGFTYPAPGSPSNGFQALQGIEDDPFGLVSMAQAETYGYATPKGSGSQQGPEIIGFVGGQLFAGALSHHGVAYTMALFGFAPGSGAGPARQMGCFQQANTEVYGRFGGNPSPDPVPAIAAQASQWAQTDPRVLAVERAWSRCMAQHGYSYRTPMQAQQHSWPSAPSAGEVATAVADVSCKTRTDLPNTWLTVEAAYQRALIAQNLTALSQLQTDFGSLLRRAEELLGSGP